MGNCHSQSESKTQTILALQHQISEHIARLDTVEAERDFHRKRVFELETRAHEEAEAQKTYLTRTVRTAVIEEETRLETIFKQRLIEERSIQAAEIAALSERKQQELLEARRAAKLAAVRGRQTQSQDPVKAILLEAQIAASLCVETMEEILSASSYTSSSWQEHEASYASSPRAPEYGLVRTGVKPLDWKSSRSDQASLHSHPHPTSGPDRHDARSGWIARGDVITAILEGKRAPEVEAHFFRQKPPQNPRHGLHQALLKMEAHASETDIEIWRNPGPAKDSHDIVYYRVRRRVKPALPTPTATPRKKLTEEEKAEIRRREAAAEEARFAALRAAPRRVVARKSTALAS
eukprot:CAMPEP_0114554752 /NCGR_PEP_ID=MMETSP0114-20121206/8380_1 /TAXON_ID=31324 /ORGANISM="Goniomonas sp, Strain m" /LENGTH=349 /DNA_ID=CAMNT_0001739825 /DNA_START=35 /DNA_END=1084 /DNA_ORIENTATION=-